MRRWKKISLLLLLLLIISIAILFPKINRVVKVMSLFSPEKIHWNFLNMEEIFPHSIINASAQKTSFVHSLNWTLPNQFNYNDSIYNVKDYLEFSQTTGLLILRGDTLLLESYSNEHSEEQDHISWSTCKSIISALFGIAYQKGFISSLNDPVDKYVPLLKGSGYEGVSCKDVLQMSSGIKFNEDYQDFNSDINKLGRVFAFGSSLDAYVKSMVRERQPGTFHQYVSMDTQVLGMVIREASGMSISAFMEEYLWQPMGAEFSGKWLIDNKGMEAAFGGFNATLRDYGRFGKLYADYGWANGKQIIDSNWIQASLSATEAHLLPGENNVLSSSDFGYGYQWWLPFEDQSIAMAMGVYNQYILVDKENKIVIVKNSGNYHYATDRITTIKRHVAFLKFLRDSVKSSHG